MYRHDLQCLQGLCNLPPHMQYIDEVPFHSASNKSFRLPATWSALTQLQAIKVCDGIPLNGSLPSTWSELRYIKDIQIPTPPPRTCFECGYGNAEPCNHTLCRPFYRRAALHPSGSVREALLTPADAWLSFGIRKCAKHTLDYSSCSCLEA